MLFKLVPPFAPALRAFSIAMAMEPALTLTVARLKESAFQPKNHPPLLEATEGEPAEEQPADEQPPADEQ